MRDAVEHIGALAARITAEDPELATAVRRLADLLAEYGRRDAEETNPPESS